jgi:hypothetical protein
LEVCLIQLQGRSIELQGRSIQLQGRSIQLQGCSIQLKKDKIYARLTIPQEFDLIPDGAR